MANYLILPKMSLNMTEGRIIQWLKKEGDKIQKGDPILAVETEKLRAEVESDHDGYLLKHLAGPGDILPVTAKVAIIGQVGEDISSLAGISTLSPLEKGSPITGREPVGRASDREKEERIFISPLAKKIAKDRGINIADIVGTGPKGRIKKSDIMSFIRSTEITTSEAPANYKPDSQKYQNQGLSVENRVPIAGMRKAIAERLSYSKANIPHVYFTVDVNAAELIKTRALINNSFDDSVVSYNDILVKAVAMAIKECKIVNASVVNDEILIYKDINIGLAVAVEGGLIVPVIKNADQKMLSEVARDSKEKIKNARDNQLSLDDIGCGTFTVSNLGMFDMEQFTAIINPPESAILAVGKILEKPVIKDGQITVQPLMNITLSADHRVIDGIVASKFLNRIKYYIENPLKAII